MKYPIITINSRETAVNLMDTDFTTRLADANTALQAALSAAETEHAGNYEQMLEAKVTATGAFFDAAFGPGTVSRIFKYHNELVEYTDVTPRPSSRHIKGV